MKFMLSTPSPSVRTLTFELTPIAFNAILTATNRYLTVSPSNVRGREVGFCGGGYEFEIARSDMNISRTLRSLG